MSSNLQPQFYQCTKTDLKGVPHSVNITLKFKLRKRKLNPGFCLNPGMVEHILILFLLSKARQHVNVANLILEC